MKYDITINLLPGIADKERQVKDRRKKQFLIIALIIMNSVVVFLLFLFTFYNRAIGRNLKDIKGKVTGVKNDLMQYIEVEKEFNDLKKRISLIDGIISSRKNWQTVIHTIADFTLKNVQLSSYSITTSSVSVSGIAHTSLDLEKQKEAYKIAVIVSDYEVKNRESWKTIARSIEMDYESFVSVHGIDPSIPPINGSIIKIRKPAFSEVVLTSMGNISSGKPVNFQFSIKIESGVL